MQRLWSTPAQRRRPCATLPPLRCPDLSVRTTRQVVKAESWLGPWTPLEGGRCAARLSADMEDPDKNLWTRLECACCRHFDFQKLHEVTSVVTRNLNKIIDVNYYPVATAERSNKRHRPIGLGVQVKMHAVCMAVCVCPDS